MGGWVSLWTWCLLTGNPFSACLITLVRTSSLAVPYLSISHVITAGAVLTLATAASLLGSYVLRLFTLACLPSVWILYLTPWLAISARRWSTAFWLRLENPSAATCCFPGT